MRDAERHVEQEVPGKRTVEQAVTRFIDRKVADIVGTETS